MSAWLGSLRGRILVGLAVLVAGLVVVAWWGTTTLRTMRREVNRELQLLRAAGDIGNRLVIAVFDEIRAAEQYLVSPAASARDRFQAAADEAFDQQARLAEVPGLTQPEQQMVIRIKRLQAEIQAEYALAHALRDLRRDREALARAAAVGAPAGELLGLVRQVASRQGDKAAVAADRLQAQAASRELLLWTVAGVVLLFGVGMARWTLQELATPLKALATLAERCGAGDLRPVTTGPMPQEFRVLAHALQTMAERLRALVIEVTAEADRIAGAAGDLSAVSEQLAASGSEVSTAVQDIAQGAESQRGELQSVAEGLERLREAMNEMEMAAGRVAELGEEIRGVADRHRGDVTAARAALLGVREVVQTASSHIAQLAQQSVAIDDFVDLVKRISSQTNLLALNAAIEAARAGEHGPGFAVVAEEVRQLADESARAAEDVARTTGAIRDQVEDVTDTMAAGHAKVRGIESVAEGAASGLAEIIGAVEHVEQAAGRVMWSAQNYREITDQLGRRAEQVTGRAVSHASSAEAVTAAVEQQGASTQEIAAATSNLLQAAEKLRGLVRGFRV
ncbi:MAG: methyl-accepting chemotaxis protein [Gemmatimonadales bacterium]